MADSTWPGGRQIRKACALTRKALKQCGAFATFNQKCCTTARIYMEQDAANQWIEHIHTARAIEGVSAHEISDAELLGLIDIESGGDAHANRRGAPYQGALQIGESMTRYMREVDAATSIMLHDAWTLTGRSGQPDATVFLGAPVLTIRFYLRTQLRLERYTGRSMLGRWLLWKAGVGAVARFVELERTRGAREARRWIASRGGLGAVLEYERRARAATARYHMMINAANEQHGICAPMLLAPRFEWFTTAADQT
jgi:hypothetical protein